MSADVCGAGGLQGPSGDLPVTAGQVHAFLLRKVKFEMVDKVQEELRALKRGLCGPHKPCWCWQDSAPERAFATRRYDVVGPEDLKGLTADDLQLLVSGKAEPVTSAQASRTSATVSSLARNDVAHVTSVHSCGRSLHSRTRAARRFVRASRTSCRRLRYATPRQASRCSCSPDACVSQTLFWETVESMDETERLKLVGMATGSLVAPPKLTIKLMECTNAAQAAYAQACIHELHVPDYREEDGSPISPAALKDVLMRTADMAETLGIDTL